MFLVSLQDQAEPAFDGTFNYVIEAENISLVPQECYKLGYYVHPDNVLPTNKKAAKGYTAPPQKPVLFLVSAYSERYHLVTTRGVYATSVVEAIDTLKSFLNAVDAKASHFDAFIEMPLSPTMFNTNPE